MGVGSNSLAEDGGLLAERKPCSGREVSGLGADLGGGGAAVISAGAAGAALRNGSSVRGSGIGV